MQQYTPLKDRTRGRWHDILTAIGLESQYLTGKHTGCPICRAGKDRFRFDDQDGRGSYICSQCGAGDGIQLVMRLRGLEFKEAAKLVEDHIGSSVVKMPNPGPTNEQKRAANNDLWGRAVPISPGDPVDRYLMNRGLSMKKYPSALQCVERLKYRGGDEYPAMIAKLTAPDGRPSTLHRTYLTSGGQKAPVDTPRMMMAGAIADGSAVRLGDAAPHMGIAEGIETALAASIMHDIPVWAACSEALMRKWEPPDTVESLVIFADNDINFIGQMAANMLAHAMFERGISISVLTPDFSGEDFNDVLIDSLSDV